MAAKGAGTQISVDAVADPAALKRLEDVIANAVAKGFQKSMSGTMEKFFTNLTRTLLKNVGATQQSATANAAQAKSFSDAEKRALEYGEELKRLGHAISVIAAETNRVAGEERRQLIDQSNVRSAAQRTKLAQLNNSAKQAAQIARTEGELQVNAAKVAGKQRTALTRSFLETIGRLEKAAGAAIVGVARTTTSAISRLYTSLGQVMRRNNSSINEGLRGSLRGREAEMRGSFGRQEAMTRASAERQIAIQRSISTGVLGGVTGRGIGGGVAAIGGGVGLVGLLTSGFQRFSDLERINKQFIALTGNVGDANDLLAEVKQFAKETPFDLVGVADLAKGFLAIKTPVKDVLTQVKIISDAVALTGGNADSLNRIQRAIGQVVSAGRLQGDELNQLAENLPGLNIRQILADQLTGGNVRQLVELQEAGELSADMFVKGLMDGLGTDPRLIGASGDLAKTLGGRLSNLKESFADFGSSLIGVIAEPLKVLFSGTQVVLQSLSDFIKGENLGPALMLVREGLKGVAVAMGLIIAAKGAVEVVGLLSKTVGLFLSPLGILLVTAGLVGGAISILVSRSEALRETLGLIRTRVGEVIAGFRERLQPTISRFSEFIENTVIPGIDRVATFLADNLLAAADKVFTFFETVAIPAVTALAKTLTTVLAPAFEFIREKATAFWNAIGPILRPAIDGFRALGSALASAIGGDFSGLGQGASSALSGIGATVSGIALAVGKALLPVGEVLVRWFTSLFSGPNLQKYLTFFLSFVEKAGEVIGRIASSPFLVKAVAGIAAAAVLLGAALAKGLVTGVVQNLPDLLALAGNALVAGFKLLLSNALIVIFGALTLGPAIASLIRKFRGVGEQAGGGFAAGFATKITAGRQFFTQAFGGAATGVRAAFDKQLVAINREMRALGAKPITLGFNVNQQSINGAKNALAQVKRGLTDAEIAGRMFRQRTIDNLNAVRGVASGLAGAVKGAFRLSFADVGAGFTGAMTSLRTLAAQQGAGIGRVLGGAIKVGAQVALSAVVGGKAAGESGGSGLFAALTAGVTGFAIGGPLVGAAAAGVSLIATAFGNAGFKLKAFREDVKKTADAITSELKTALDEGRLAVTAFTDGLNIGDVAGTTAVRATFIDELGDDGVATLARFGVQWDKSLLPILQQGGDLDQLKNKLKTTFVESATASTAFATTFGKDSKDVSNLIRGAVRDRKSAGDFIDSINVTTASKAERAILANESFVRDLINTSGDLTRAAGITAGALDVINAKTDVFGVERPTAPLVGSINTVEQRLVDLGLVIGGVQGQFNTLFNPGDNTLIAAIDNATLVAAGLGGARGDGTGVTGGAQQRSSDRQIADQIAQVLTVGVNEGLVISKTSALSAVKPIIDAYVSGITDPKTAAKVRADLETAVAGFALNIPAIVEANASADVFKQLVEKGFGEADVSLDTGKLLLAAGTTMEEVKKFINDPAHRPLLKLSFDEQAAITAANQTADAAGREFKLNGPSMNINGQLIGKQLADGMIEGMDSKQKAVAEAAARLGRAATASANRNLNISSPSKVFAKIGRQIGDGLVEGIIDSVPAVTDALAQMLGAPGVPKIDSYGRPYAANGAPAAAPAMGATTSTSAANAAPAGNVTFQTTINAPTDDPAAIALAVANRQASALFRRSPVRRPSPVLQGAY